MSTLTEAERLAELAHGAWLWDCGYMSDQSLAQLMSVLLRPYQQAAHPSVPAILRRNGVQAPADCACGHSRSLHPMGDDCIDPDCDCDRWAP